MTGPGWWALMLAVVLILPGPIARGLDVIQRARARRRDHPAGA